MISMYLFNQLLEKSEYRLNLNNQKEGENNG